MNIIESGPAGGVVGAQALAPRHELDENHHLRHGRHHRQGLDGRGRRGDARARSTPSARGIMVGSRLLTGAGYTLKVPAIDLAEVGAGGGSHHLDRCRRRPAGGARERRRLAGPGLLRHRRRGADHHRRQRRPGLPQPGASGRRRAEAQRRRRRARRSRPRSPSRWACRSSDAAYGAHVIAASNMIRAIKAVSTERGRDPREFALFAFGGNGPLFAGGMAAPLGISRVIVPPVARPVLVLRPALCRRRAPLRAHLPPAAAAGRSRRDRRRLDADWRGRRRQLAVEGFTGRRATAALGRRCTTRGRASSWPCRCRTGRSTPAWWRIWRRPLAASTRGLTAIAPAPEEPVELVSIQLVGQGLREGGGVPQQVKVEPAGAAGQAVAAGLLGDHEAGWKRRAVPRRPRGRRSGPAVVEEYDATCVVPPGARAQLDASGNIVITL